MGTLGSYLRSAREARDLDLRDAAQQTRISINYLKAIEDEDFAKLPGEVFIKGFLKNYARYLGLPEDEVLKRYGELRQPSQGAGPAPTSNGQRPERSGPVAAPDREPHEGRGEKNSIGIEVYVWSAVILVALVWFLVSSLPKRLPPEEQGPGALSRMTGTAELMQTAGTATMRSEKLYLEIVALDDAWVLIRTDGSPQKKAVLKKGEKITWSADERFLVTYGNAGAVQLLLNGRELPVESPANAVVRDLIITANGIASHKVEVERPPRKPRPPQASTAPQQSAAPGPSTAVSPTAVGRPAPAVHPPVTRPTQTAPSGRPAPAVQPPVTRPVQTAPPETERPAPSVPSPAKHPAQVNGPPAVTDAPGD